MLIDIAQLNDENYLETMINYLRVLQTEDYVDSTLVVDLLTENEVVYDKNNPMWLNAINTICGRLGRHLEADRDSAVQTIHLKKITAIHLQNCNSAHVKGLLLFFCKAFYPAVTELTFSITKDINFDDLFLKDILNSKLKKININVEMPDENAKEKIRKLLHHIIEKSAEKIDVYLNNELKTLSSVEEVEMEVDTSDNDDQKTAMAVDSTAAPKPLAAQNYINKYSSFKKVLSDSFVHNNCSDIDINLKIDVLFYSWGRLSFHPKEAGDAGKALIDLTKAIQAQKNGNQNIYFAKLEHFFNENNNHGELVSAHELQEAKDFYKKFLLVFANSLDIIRVHMVKMLNLEKKACLIPYCENFNDYLNHFNKYDRVLAIPKVVELINQEILSPIEVHALAKRYDEILKNKEMDFPLLLNLIEENSTAFGAKKMQIILRLMLSKADMNIAYLPSLLNYCLQLNYGIKKTTASSAENSELEAYIALIEKSTLNNETFPAFKEQLEEILMSAHRKRFPEKPLDTVFAEFTTQTETLKFPMSVEEAKIVFAKYQILNAYSNDLTKVANLNEELSECLKKLTIDPQQALLLLAIIREQVKRIFKFLPYNLQMINILAILNDPTGRRLAQINTGEGKSVIIAMLAAYVALNGKKIDIITTAKDLAVRDTEKFTPFFKALQLTVGHNAREDKDKRPEHYKPHVLYGTLTDFQFAYLWENLNKFSRAGRGFEAVIVDEADNMFLDTQSRPAYISLPNPKFTSELYHLIMFYITAQDTELDGLGLQKFLLERTGVKYSRTNIERWLKGSRLARSVGEDKHYVIRNNKVVIVDYQHTGQLNVGSRWQNGAHEFVEAYHGLKTKAESFCSAQVTNLEYLNLYTNIYGLTGTLGNRDELLESYKLTTYDSPPYAPSRKTHVPDIVAPDAKQQGAAIVECVFREVANGRPVLIICQTITHSIRISRLLKNNKYKIQNYNAIQAQSSETILGLAGNPGVITIATNAAGRGADISTTPKAEENNGLLVIATYPPINSRVETQIFGRTGRQGRGGGYHYILDINDLFAFLPRERPTDSREIIALWKQERERRNEQLSKLRRRERLFFNIEFVAQSVYFPLSNFHKQALEDAWSECYDTITKTISNLTQNQFYGDNQLFEAGYMTTLMINKFFLENKLDAKLGMPGATVMHYAAIKNNKRLFELCARFHPQLVKQIDGNLKLPTDYITDSKLLEFVKSCNQFFEKYTQFFHDLQKKYNTMLDDDYEEESDDENENDEKATETAALQPTQAELLVRSSPLLSHAEANPHLNIITVRIPDTKKPESPRP